MVDNLFRMKTRMVSIPVNSSGSIPAPDGSIEPIGWTGPEPVLYWSLDTLEGLILMEGTQQKDYDALAEGKVGLTKNCINQSGLVAYM